MSLLGAKRSTWVDQVVQTMEASVIRSDTRESWAQELGAVMGGLVLVSHRRGVAGPPRVVYLLDEAWCHDARSCVPKSVLSSPTGTMMMPYLRSAEGGPPSETV